jgi:glucose/mannose transport system substrate-binding protein
MTPLRARARWAFLPVFAIVLAACSAGNNAAASGSGAAGGVQQVEIFSWWTTGGEAAGLTKLMDKFNKDNPQYHVFNQAVAGGAGSNAKAVLKTRMLGGDPPDSFQVHMGHELVDTWVTTDYMQPLDDLFQANGWTQDFPKGVLDIVSYNGHYWSVPVNIHRANVLWYSKKAFQTAGISAPPKTWAEFKTDADMLKAKGITPLALGGHDTFAVGQLFEVILIGDLGADGYKGLWTGATSWTDAKVTQALNDFKTAVSYTSDDNTSLTWDQAADRLIDSKAAMTIMGDWTDGEFVNKKFTDYGWAPAPGNDGIYDALSDTFGLPKGAKHADAVKKFLTLLGSAEGQDLFNPLKGSIPANTKGGNPPAGEKQYDDYLKSAMSDWKSNTIVPSLEHGAAAKPSWVTDFTNAIVNFATSGDVAGTQSALAAACTSAGVCK